MDETKCGYARKLEVSDIELITYNKLISMIETNRDKKECLCEYFELPDIYVKPYFDRDIVLQKEEEFKTFNNEEELQKTLQFISKLFQCDIQDISISTDNRFISKEENRKRKVKHYYKYSNRLIITNQKIQGKKLQKIVNQNKNEFKNHHLDTVPYSKKQKIKTLYSKKNSCIHSTGLIPLNYTNDISKHIIQLNQQELQELQETLVDLKPKKPKEQKQEIATTIEQGTNVIETKKDKEILDKVLDLLQYHQITGITFQGFKNGNTILFRRTQTSKCFWGNEHSTQCMYIQFYKTITGYCFYGVCCGNECMHQMYDFNKLDNVLRSPDSIKTFYNKMKNSKKFNLSYFKYIDYQIFTNIQDYKETNNIILQTFNRHFFFNKNADGEYIEIHNSNVSFRKQSLMISLFRPFVLHFQVNDKIVTYELCKILLLMNKNIQYAIDRLSYRPELEHGLFFENGIQQYNLWNGFKIQRELEYEINETFTLNDDTIQEMLHNNEPIFYFLRHIYYVFCSGNQEQFFYILQWFSSLFKYPQNPLPLLIFKSAQGTGKNIITEFIGNRIIGEEGFLITDKSDQILGRFNSCMLGKSLIVLDECNSFVGNHEINNLLKGLVTQNTINIERKGKEVFTIETYAKKIMQTNNDACVYIDETDRRFFCPDFNDVIVKDFSKMPELLKQGFTTKEEYFDHLISILNSDEIAKDVFTFFYGMDITNYNPKKIIYTKTKTEMRELSKTPLEIFFEDYELEYIDGKLLNDVYHNYETNYCRNRKALSCNVFSKKVQEYYKVITVRKMLDGERKQCFVKKESTL